MLIYKDLSGESGIRAYELGPDFIDVEFSDGSVYRYSNDCPGERIVNEMKELAELGEGLNSFINKKVKKKYSAKLS